MSKKIATSALLLAVALVLGYIEALFFNLPSLPGLKLGLANIVILLALYRLGNGYALMLSVLKAALSAFLFGNPVGMLYSLLGSLLAWCGMVITRRGFGIFAVSVVGGVLHNLGQLIIACLLTKSFAPVGYAPLLIVGGVVFGLLTALLSQSVLRQKKIGSKN